jgi:DNA-binding PadR family transcriptional regulator
MSSLNQLRKGSTNLLVLDLLNTARMHGYQIMRELEQRSNGYFTMTAALLYPALHQLEEDGLVTSVWEEGPGKRTRKYYQITDAGRAALERDRAGWTQFIEQLSRTLRNPLDPGKENAV